MYEIFTIKSKIRPNKIEAGQLIEIECNFKGTLHFGFFDAVLRDKDGRSLVWMPDRSNWNRFRDTGTLEGTDVFSSKWNHFIPDWITEGKYKILVQVYDDKEGKKPEHRRPIAEEEHTIEILSSRHPEAIFVRTLYRRFLERIPDIPGFKTWFSIIQIQKASRRQLLEIGFLRSPEFRARFIHKFLLQQRIEDKDLNYAINFLKNYHLSDLLNKKYSQIISKVKISDRIISHLKLDDVAIAELKRIEKTTDNPEDFLVSIIENFLLEKYILITCLFPNLSEEESQEKVRRYLTNPEQIVNEI